MEFFIRISRNNSSIQEFFELRLGENDSSSDLDRMTRIIRYLTKRIASYHNLQSVIIQGLPFYTSMRVTITLYRKDMIPLYKNVRIPYRNYTKFMKTLHKLLNELFISTTELTLRSPSKEKSVMIGIIPSKLKTGPKTEFERLIEN